LKAFSILSLLSGSFVIVLEALAVPVRRPISPPKNVPPMENRMKVAASPHFEGDNFAVISGMGSSKDQY
jgi:hypothetical protein